MVSLKPIFMNFPLPAASREEEREALVRGQDGQTYQEVKNGDRKEWESWILGSDLPE